MKVQRAKLAPADYIWLVLDENHLPINPIFEFLRYQRNIARSPNTLRAYANHLKLYWDFLHESNLSWQTIKYDELASFIHWLSHMARKRKPTTVNSILSVITAFYEFHQRLGHVNDPQLVYWDKGKHLNHYKPFLSHGHRKGLVKRNRLKLKVPRQILKTIKPEIVKKIIASTSSCRDQFLVSLLYETGMRIGQALGLYHEDIKSWDNEIHIVPRQNNQNQALSKSLNANILPVSPNLLTLYSKYLTEECGSIESEFVFIKTQGQPVSQPLEYSAIAALFRRLSKKIGLHITPHMLRHTHTTELIQEGWDSSYVQKRLGHASVQTTLNTYAHIDIADLKKAFLKFTDSKRN